MNNNRKLLFFDIDGTLLTAYPWSIPESTRKALEAARKRPSALRQLRTHLRNDLPYGQRTRF